jgi:Tfp pilus assembly protein PilN
MKFMGINASIWAIVTLLVVIAGGVTYLANAHREEQAAEQAAMQREAQRQQAEQAEADKAHKKLMDDIEHESSFKLLK